MNEEPTWVHKFRRFGLRFLLFPYIAIVWWLYNKLIITDAEIEFSWAQFIWLWLLRLSSILVIPGALPVLLTILFYSPPPLKDDGQCSKAAKAKVHALIFRIVTIGNYPKMIQNAISYHSDLLKNFIDCDNFSIHLVTEKPLNMNRLYPNLVREILVPKSYQSPKGALGKARNLAYWAATNQLGHLDESKTWILDIDEDVILSQSFMRDLAEKFLLQQNRPKIGLPQAIMKTKETDSYLAVMTQAYRFIMDLAHHYPCMRLWNQSPVLCHGGCYVARADCSMDKTADSDPYCTVSDDNAYTMKMVAKGISLEFMNGWFFEDAPPSFMGNVYQRARWIKGQTYLFFYVPVPWSQKIGLGLWLLGMYFLIPLFFFTRPLFVAALMAGFVPGFLPAGPTFEIGILDFMTVLIIATTIYATFYGCWFVMPWYRAVYYSVLALTGIPLLLLQILDFITIMVTHYTIFKEILQRKTVYTVTEKNT